MILMKIMVMLIMKIVMILFSIMRTIIMMIKMIKMIKIKKSHTFIMITVIHQNETKIFFSKKQAEILFLYLIRHISKFFEINLFLCSEVLQTN